jgi:hypothetical protein
MQLVYNFHTCDYIMCSHSHCPRGTSFVIGFQWWSLFMKFFSHYVAINYCTTSCPLLCHYCTTTMPLCDHPNATNCYICATVGPQYWHYLPINKILPIHFPYKMWICKPQIGSQCYINYIKNIYIGGTSRYSTLYT